VFDLCLWPENKPVLTKPANNQTQPRTSKHKRAHVHTHLDAKLRRALGRARVHPPHVLLVVGVEFLALPLLRPQDEVRVLDAVRRRARRLGQGAQRELGLRREEP
jgi:hypothetical protein